MTKFDEREHTFGHDEEMRFKARGRKNRMLGLWAAGLMGKTGASAEAHACDIVMADFEKPGDHDVVHTLMHDLDGAGRSTEEQAIRRQGERFMAENMKQVMTEMKK
jgi:hypothetical protein